MTYPQAIQYLESFINYEKIPVYPYKESLKLERIRGFLERIDNPQASLSCIHIAGTKGKGSTCAFIAYILREAGYKVGLYTSPHLSDFRERIRILTQKTEDRVQKAEFEGMISKEELAGLAERLKPAIENYNKNSKYGPMSFFEVYTALAFEHFRENKVDFAVLETGLGGRLDATNVVEPLVCAITPISYEHTQKLGSTLREIATEKAGIIKVRSSRLPASSLIVISAPQVKEAQEVIRNKCTETGAKLYEVNKDIFFEKTAQGFNVMGAFGEYPNLEIQLLGGHQIINASIAVGAVEALRFYDIFLDANSIRGGLYNTVWPGRCEIISKNPMVILDGAQNGASSKALKETVLENFPGRRIILVLGISGDKDIKGICRNLVPLAAEVILTKANNPRAADTDEIEKIIGRQSSLDYARDRPVASRLVEKTENVQDALQFAVKKAAPKDIILVTGSLFVVGEAREVFLASLPCAENFRI
jgi:dihydrofolate synthase / folylpolyglutamate synthase